MIERGLCSVLASDYYYPAPLLAAFALARGGVLPLARAWALVSQAPAKAMRLDDRGRRRLAEAVDEIRRGSVRRVVLPSGSVTLTAREWEVGETLRDGQSTAEIAEHLGVSPITVRRHVSLLLQKLGADSREAAVEMLRTYGRR